MIHERDVRSKMIALLRAEISIEDFDRWIVDQSWNMHRDSAADAIDLVSDIHILLAERSDGAYNDDAFLCEIARLLGPVRRDVWVSANVPVVVSVRFAVPEPQSCIINSTATQGYRRLEPVLVEL